MKTRFLSLALALCLLCGLAAYPASAAQPQDDAVRTVQALGIFNGSDLSATASRGQFAAMLAAAARQNDAGPGGYALFTDVRNEHWAASYIQLAVEQGWMSGYLDGSFRPDQGVTLEEACTAALKLLGYDPSALPGAFPAAQLNKAAALGLRDQLSAQPGDALTRLDCARLFYALLSAKTSSGQVYAASLGLTVSNGALEDASLVRDGLSGPYVAQTDAPDLPFHPTLAYVDGEAQPNASLRLHDVYYYNENLRTLWIYRERVSGTITALTPNAAAPENVTVAGTSYPIGGAAYAMSALGGHCAVGDTVTLLLGMDGKVEAVLTGDAVNAVYYGVLQTVSRAAGDSGIQTDVTLLCTDGETRSFSLEQDNKLTVGKLASVTVSSQGVRVQTLTERRVSGKVDADGTKLDRLAFAENIQILDTDTQGGGVVLKPARLAGCTLQTSDVRYYALNEAGQLAYLILNDATGDLWTYAYLKTIDDQSQERSIQVNYTYLADGAEHTFRSSGSKFAVSPGGVAIRSDGGSVQSMRNLSSVKLSELTASWAMADGRQLSLAENVQVYILKNGSYYLSTPSAVRNGTYRLTGWYDQDNRPAGGQLRLILAS